MTGVDHKGHRVQTCGPFACVPLAVSANLCPMPHINKQQPEPIQRIPEGAVEVHHAFHTIQGEGPFAGTPAVFLRLAGCNLQCPWCDTEYTSQRKLTMPSKVVELVISKAERRTGLVVVTGGEPLRQNIGPMCVALLRAGWLVQVETNGTLYDKDLPYDHNNFWIVCSPKMPRINPNLMPHIDALKYVLEDGHVDPNDGLPSSTLGGQLGVGRPNDTFRGIIYVQPLDVQDDGANALNTAAAVASSLTFGHRLCIQTHKLCGLE